MRRLCLLMLALASRGLAESSDGGGPDAWMNLGLGARQLALGQATTALEGDAYALSGNPAGLVSLTRISLGSQTALLSEDRRLEHLAFARPLDLKFWRPGVGLSVSRFALEAPVERRDTNTPDPVAQWFQSSYAIQAGLASWIGDGSRTHSAAGFTLRLLSDSIGESNGGGLALDFGSLYRAKTWLNIGWVVDNVMGQSSWSTGSTENYPRELRLGAAAKLWDRRLLLTTELAKSEIQDYRIRAGLECWVTPELLAIRAGVDQDRFSAGLGAKWDFEASSLSFDYAVRTDPVVPEYLDHRFSLSYDFEP